ncbi:MAG: glycoside hydrolase family 16 protein [Clostridia bacterium]|nr:glycoside hydrolase family 16 protein [Clostridia bacterium]
MDLTVFLKALWAVVLSMIMTVSGGGFPRIPHEKDFTLIWHDEFDGDKLDETKWKGHYCGNGEPSVRRGSYWHTDMATVKDGNLHIATRFYPNGFKGNGKPGWYTCGLDTRGLFEQAFGYFEIRCILPKGGGMWAAFWMLCDGMSNVDGSGTDGAEIDIFEAPYYAEKNNRRISSNIHIDGYGEGLKSTNVCKPYILVNDPYENYNTYGLEWNENEYIFYINGIETGRSSFGGTSRVPEFLLLSVEVGGENAVPGESWASGVLKPGTKTSDFIVDYVRVYKYN